MNGNESEPTVTNRSSDYRYRSQEDTVKTALDDMRRTEAFCKCAAIGSATNVQLMVDMLKNDPRKLTSS